MCVCVEGGRGEAGHRKQLHIYRSQTNHHSSLVILCHSLKREQRTQSCHQQRYEHCHNSWAWLYHNKPLKTNDSWPSKPTTVGPQNQWQLAFKTNDSWPSKPTTVGLSPQPPLCFPKLAATLPHCKWWKAGWGGLGQDYDITPQKRLSAAIKMSLHWTTYEPHFPEKKRQAWMLIQVCRMHFGQYQVSPWTWTDVITQQVHTTTTNPWRPLTPNLNKLHSTDELSVTVIGLDSTWRLDTCTDLRTPWQIHITMKTLWTLEPEFQQNVCRCIDCKVARADNESECYSASCSVAVSLWCCAVLQYSNVHHINHTDVYMRSPPTTHVQQWTTHMCKQQIPVSFSPCPPRAWVRGY